MSVECRYRVTIESVSDHEGGGYVAFVPALQGSHTQGETLDEVVQNIRHAATPWLEDALDRGQALPGSDSDQADELKPITLGPNGQEHSVQFRTDLTVAL